MRKPIKRIALMLFGSFAWIACLTIQPGEQMRSDDGGFAILASLSIPQAFAESDNDSSSSSSDNTSTSTDNSSTSTDNTSTDNTSTDNTSTDNTSTDNTSTDNSSTETTSNGLSACTVVGASGTTVGYWVPDSVVNADGTLDSAALTSYVTTVSGGGSSTPDSSMKSYRDIRGQ